MKIELRVVVFAATALICTTGAVVLGGNSLFGSPVVPEAAPVLARAAGTAAESQPDPVRMRSPREAADAALRENAVVAKSPTQRVEVDVSAAKQPLPLTDQDRVRIRAAAVATKLELTAVAADELLGVLLAEQSRRADAFSERRRDPEGAKSNARLRAALDDIRAWKSQELRQRFGAERATAMQRRGIGETISGSARPNPGSSQSYPPRCRKLSLATTPILDRFTRPAHK